MVKIVTPCKGCEDRAVGCHSVCDKYITWKAERDEIKREMTKIAMQEQEQNDIEKSRKKRIATGRFSKSRRTK